ncbi:MAG TPA: LamG domain-containing protein, partial [Pseudonocardiaceae bacterium]
TGDNIPDAVTVGGQHGIPAGLWQAQGQFAVNHPGGSGNIMPTGVDIGVHGNGLDPAQATNSPADFTGGQAITGHFTGSPLQDVLVYYPNGYLNSTNTTVNAGAAEIIAGNGDGSVLQPQQAFNTTLINADTFKVNNTSPSQLVNAGIAPDAPTGWVYPDLIGRTATTTGGYLTYYYVKFGSAGTYGLHAQLATPSPDGTTDWNNWTITTCQTTDPTSRAVHTDMFLWNQTTGELDLWTNISHLSGTDSVSYTPHTLTGSWNPGAAITLQAADIDADGTPDLFAVGPGGSVSAYLVTDLTAPPAAHSSQTLSTSTHTWALGDAPNPATGPVSTTADVTGTLPATGIGGTSWNTGDLFAPDVSLDGTSGALATARPAVDTTADFTISAWVKPNTLGGAVLSQDGGNNAGFELFPDATNGQWTFGMTTNDSNTSYQWVRSIAGPVGVNVWSHITATYHQATGMMALYVNGSPAGSAVHTTPGRPPAPSTSVTTAPTAATAGTSTGRSPKCRPGTRH